jgi:preprotein translocase subunit SecG
MNHIILIVHLVVAVALVVVVLMQRSEGGALGIGGGGASFLSGRSGSNPLTRATALLAAVFFLTSIGLTILARSGGETRSILDSPPAVAPAPLSEPVPQPPAAPAAPLAE